MKKKYFFYNLSDDEHGIGNKNLLGERAVGEKDSTENFSSKSIKIESGPGKNAPGDSDKICLRLENYTRKSNRITRKKFIIITTTIFVLMAFALILSRAYQENEKSIKKRQAPSPISSGKSFSGCRDFCAEAKFLFGFFERLIDSFSRVGKSNKEVATSNEDVMLLYEDAANYSSKLTSESKKEINPKFHFKFPQTEKCMEFKRKCDQIIRNHENYVQEIELQEVVWATVAKPAPGSTKTMTFEGARSIIEIFPEISGNNNGAQLPAENIIWRIQEPVKALFNFLLTENLALRLQNKFLEDFSRKSDAFNIDKNKFGIKLKDLELKLEKKNDVHWCKIRCFINRYMYDHDGITAYVVCSVTPRIIDYCKYMESKRPAQ